MLIKAIEKIQDEMNNNAQNLNIQAAGKFLLQYMDKNENAAAKVLNPEKSIKGGMEVMSEEAKKSQINGMACIPDQEGFKIILKYFEINDDDKDNAGTTGSSMFDMLNNLTNEKSGV